MLCKEICNLSCIAWREEEQLVVQANKPTKMVHAAQREDVKTPSIPDVHSMQANDPHKNSSSYQPKDLGTYRASGIIPGSMFIAYNEHYKVYLPITMDNNKDE